MKTQEVSSCLVVTLLFSASAALAEPPQPVYLWPDRAPAAADDGAGERVLPARGGKPVTRITDIRWPNITVFKPPKEQDTGAAVVICPGGGYNILAIDLEGEEVAKWLNSIGVTGVLLKYRVPWKRGQADTPEPLQDAQRALRITRKNAAQWNIDPERIGLMGFSAGGHLTAWAGTNFDKKSYEPIDAADQLSCRPDFLMQIYPAYMVDHTKDNHLAGDIRVSERTPPTLLIHTGDDKVTAESSVYFYLAMKKAGVPAELHIYPTGGHGYGLRKSDHAVSTWPARAETWLRAMGYLEK